MHWPDPSYCITLDWLLIAYLNNPQLNTPTTGTLFVHLPMTTWSPPTLGFTKHFLLWRYTQHAIRNWRIKSRLSSLYLSLWKNWFHRRQSVQSP